MRRQKIVIGVLLFISILVLSISVMGDSFLDSGLKGITGNFIVPGSESSAIYEDEIGKDYSTNSVFLWEPHNKVILNGLALSGSVSGSGHFKAYLIDDEDVYLITSYEVDNEVVNFSRDCRTSCNLPDLTDDKYIIKYELDNVSLNIVSVSYSEDDLGNNEKVKETTELVSLNKKSKSSSSYSTKDNYNQLFITYWDTSLSAPGDSGIASIKLPLDSDGVYNFTVDWGNGLTSHITRYNDSYIQHLYPHDGIYKVIINGTIDGFRFDGKGDKSKLIGISQWGNLKVGNKGNYFLGCENLIINATDTLNTTSMTNFSGFFKSCKKIDFPVNNWDMSNAVDISAMFYNDTKFNHPINNWNLSKVVNMSYFLFRNYVFDQDINDLDVSNVKDMRFALSRLASFNRPLDHWDVSNVENMRGMFEFSVPFNHSINNWDVSKVKDMSYMFDDTWDFNQPLDQWDVSNVENMSGMFYASKFNNPINSWDVSKVKDMSYLFFATSFNQPLDHWDVSNVKKMDHMFVNIPVYEYNLSMWNYTNVESFTGMFDHTILVTDNYDSLLKAWANNSRIHHNINFSGGRSYYCTAVNERNRLINVFNWSITDYGKSCASKENSSTFISIWNPRKLSGGSSRINEIRLPLESTGDYNFSIYWGDGNIDNITSYNQPEVTHTYNTLKPYKLLINGKIKGFRFNGFGDRNKILSIEQWGNLNLGNNGAYFKGCPNLVINATDAPDLEGTTNLSDTFSRCISLNSDLDSWNTSGVKDMSYMFLRADIFNGSLNSWDVSNVTNMAHMFENAYYFNRPLDQWDVSNVENMSWFLTSAYSFNQSLNDWNVSNVKYMDYMFADLSSFNQPLDQWDVSNVEDMQWMFALSNPFDQDISSWNVSNVNNMSHMFFDVGDPDPVGLSVPNYDRLLSKWSNLSLKHNVQFTAGKSQYCLSENPRNNTLIGTYGWSISDAGKNCSYCGNGVIDQGEICDGVIINKSCNDLGYNSGILSCTSSCTYDISGCSNTTSSSASTTSSSNKKHKKYYPWIDDGATATSKGSSAHSSSSTRVVSSVPVTDSKPEDDSASTKEVVSNVERKAPATSDKGIQVRTYDSQVIPTNLDDKSAVGNVPEDISIDPLTKSVIVVIELFLLAQLFLLGKDLFFIRI